MEQFKINKEMRELNTSSNQNVTDRSQTENINHGKPSQKEDCPIKYYCVEAICKPNNMCLGRE
jgi:hypothetical protein